MICPLRLCFRHPDFRIFFLNSLCSLPGLCGLSLVLLLRADLAAGIQALYKRSIQRVLNCLKEWLGGGSVTRDCCRTVLYIFMRLLPEQEDGAENVAGKGAAFPKLSRSSMYIYHFSDFFAKHKQEINISSS